MKNCQEKFKEVRDHPLWRSNTLIPIISTLNISTSRRQLPHIKDANNKAGAILEMVDISHLRNRKVIAASLVGVAVVAISVGVGVGVTRGKKRVHDDTSNAADSADDIHLPGPSVDKDSFLRINEIPDILDAISEAEAEEVVEQVDASPRVHVNYNSNIWRGGGSWKCGSGSSSSKGSKGSSSSSSKSSPKGRRRCKFLSLPLSTSYCSAILHYFITHSILSCTLSSLILQQ